MTVYALIFVAMIGPGAFHETLALYSTEKACINAGYFLKIDKLNQSKLECRQMQVRDGTEFPRREMNP